MRGSTEAERVIPPAADITNTQVPANMQKLKQPAVIPDAYGGRDIDRTVYYRVRVDVPVDPITGLPTDVIPTIGDNVEVLNFPSSPFLHGMWNIARVEPDTGFLPSLLLFVQKELDINPT
jgi:hypothetical protein